MTTKIISDSSCDIWTLDGIEFKTVPLTIYTSERTYLDDETLNVHEMLDYLAEYKDRSYTSCPDVANWVNAFEGGDEIYVTTLTSGLSGTYNSALVAKDIYLDKHPHAKILVIDTLSTSAEQLLIVEKLKELKLSGKTFDEISDLIRPYMQTTRLFFAFKSLHNFAQNGRVPKILAQAIGILGISIIGTASNEGKVEPISKCRGPKSVISNLMEQLKQAGYKGGKLKICHVENEDLAKQF